MKRCLGFILFLLLVGFSGVAAEKETLEQLIARADSATASQQPDLYLEIADRELKIVTESYKANKLEDAHASLQQVVTYADKAHEGVLKSGKKLPHSEIKIRRLAARLRDLKRDVEADEQPGVQAAVDKLEGFRSDLLKAMFGSKNSESK